MTTAIEVESPTLGVARRPLRRGVRRALVGGVCAGLAVRFGVRARTIRVMFAVASLFSGLGLVVYVVTWLGVARFGEDESIAQRLGRRRSDARAISLVSVVVVVALAGVIGLWGPGGFVWSLAISAIGLVGVWRGASEAELLHLDEFVRNAPVVGSATKRGWRGVVLRVIPGVVLVAVGMNVLSRVGGVWGAAVPALIGTAVVVLGGLVLFAPWWLSTVGDLTRERRDRVRAEERSAMAAHLHDSVLQSLTLIERVAHDPDEVVRIARAEERSLRRWLFADDARNDDGRATLSSLLEEVHEEVERDYGVTVEVVSVGDAPVDDRVRALVAATREALRNAATWSGVKRIAVYAEVEPDRISVFVRDTGVGFDTTAVAADRQGIALSIKERMTQSGGRASVRSSPGEGTEVELVLEGT